VIGGLIGWLASKLSAADVRTTRLSMICIGFQETTAIPLVMASALAQGSFVDDRSDFESTATSCVLIYTVFSTLLKWSYAYW
jgi:uncharacterized membrane protein YeaQ/YmgE (transglycosylase-associated protein family)